MRIGLGISLTTMRAGGGGAPVPDYIVTTDGEWDTVFANTDGTLSGKTVAVSGDSFTARTLTARAFSPALTLTSLDAASKLPQIILAGVDGLTCDGLNLQEPDWPTSSVSLVRFSGANANLKFLNGTFRHGYDVTLDDLDPEATYAEYTDTFGLAVKLTDAFSSQGGTTNAGLEIRGNTFSDLSNAVKGLGTLSGTTAIWDNTLLRIYQDIVSIGRHEPTTADDWLLVERNIYTLPFAVASDDGNPHGDIFQLGSTGPVDTGQIIFAGNVPIYQARRAGANGAVQGVFISDTDANYYDISIVGNILSGGALRGISIGEEPTDPANHILVDATTIVSYIDGGNTPGILLTDTVFTTNNHISRTIGESFPTANATLSVEETHVFSFASPTATFPNWADRLTATTRAQTLAAFSTVGTAAEDLGAADLFADLIDLTTEDPFAVVQWANVRPSVDWIDQTDVALSTVITLALKKVLGGPLAMTVVPTSGVEWRSVDTDGTTEVQAWTASSGVIDRGQYIQLRATSSGTGLTATVITAALNGATTGCTVTTEVGAPAVYLTAGAASAFADPSNLGAGVTVLRFEGKFNFPSTLPADEARLFAQSSAGCDLSYEVTGTDLQLNIENAAGTAIASGDPNVGFGVFSTGVWYDIAFEVDQVANTAETTINGVLFSNTLSGGDSFQTARFVAFMSNGTTNFLPTGTMVADLAVYKNGVLHKAISNVVATANADPWKIGADAFT